MRRPVREARFGFAFAGVVFGSLVSVVDPAGHHFDVPAAVTGAVKGLLLCAAVVMVIVALRQLRRSV